MTLDKAKSLLTLLAKAAGSRRHMVSRSIVFCADKIKVILSLTEETLLKWVGLVSKESFDVKLGTFTLSLKAYFR